MLKMNKIWLDLELREDIDDFITLLLAINSGLNITAVSINNPSRHELKLVGYVLRKYCVEARVFMTGSITEYPDKKDTHPVLRFTESDLYYEPELSFISALAEKELSEPFTVFCGGSLTTLNKLVDAGCNVSAVVQGGYASSLVVPEHAVLKKFDGRAAVPTWNLNLDLASTDEVLAKGIDIRFISKNVCHAALVGLEDISNETSFGAGVLRRYFEYSGYRDKCMHDPLALTTMLNPNIVDFASVEMKRTDDARAKWWAEPRNDSNHTISIDFDKDAFLAAFVTGLRDKD